MDIYFLDKSLLPPPPSPLIKNLKDFSIAELGDSK